MNDAVRSTLVTVLLAFVAAALLAMTPERAPTAPRPAPQQHDSRIAGALAARGSASAHVR